MDWNVSVSVRCPRVLIWISFPLQQSTPVRMSCSSPSTIKIVLWGSIFTLCGEAPSRSYAELAQYLGYSLSLRPWRCVDVWCRAAAGTRFAFQTAVSHCIFKTCILLKKHMLITLPAWVRHKCTIYVQRQWVSISSKTLQLLR